MSLLSQAEEIKEGFLSKAVGNAIKWTQVPGLKLHNQGSDGTFYVSCDCIGVAARAHVTMPFDLVEINEVLKDRPSWSRLCRKMSVINTYLTSCGNTIELISTQYYSPTNLASARDFWTLRYTSVLDDGSIVVCEGSVCGSHVAPCPPTAIEFIRGEKLASGYIICPNEEGSTIYMVEHFDMEALHYIEHMANEKSGKLKQASCEDPVSMRFISQRLSRDFNEAVNGFREDGWTLLNVDTSHDLMLSVKTIKSSGANPNDYNVLCIRSAILLHNVFPADMTRALKEHLSAWVYKFSGCDSSDPCSEAVSFASKSNSVHNLVESTDLLGYTSSDEALEATRFKYNPDCMPNVSSGDLYHLMLINGMEDTGFGACSELICAPYEKSMFIQSFVLSFGFRVIMLGSSPESGTSTDLTPKVESNKRKALTSSTPPPSLLVLAFEFPFQGDIPEGLVVMARQYIQSVISSAKDLALEVMMSGERPEKSAKKDIPETAVVNPNASFADNLATLLCLSYNSIKIQKRSLVGLYPLDINYTGSFLELVQHLPHAILCVSFSSIPVPLYANDQAMTMLEATEDTLQMVEMERILGFFDDYHTLRSVVPVVLYLGYCNLRKGVGLTLDDNIFSYKKGVVWQVQHYDGSIHCLAMAFQDWKHM
ncbi:homeobox-leucine zipper protein REVOLUTA-like isoform X2 [Andrographis paniculata]|uniref:homeobox-leucine zipper protein REVOLUTA-like isoform X2 n=1 Tax=Andrographis paniculata TaxID=175694 RepID=UPI0021E7E276|nr:homeobox-leucine zipper protein REVOLUTA-like isoform X2 [Andrographis paniculata]